MTTALIFLAPGTGHTAAVDAEATVPSIASTGADVLAEELELIAAAAANTDPDEAGTIAARLAAIDATGVDLLARLDRLDVSSSQAVRLALGPLPAVGDAPDDAVYTAAIADLRRAAETPTAVAAVAAEANPQQRGLLAAGGAALVVLAAVAVVGARRRRPVTTVPKDAVAWSDGLTGLANRRRFDADVEALADRPTAAILLDVDHLHDVNDDFGYGLGDQIVCEVGECLSSQVRSGDVVYRFGGAEFCVLLPGATVSDARDVADRIVAAVHAIALPDGRTVTVSAGVAAAENGPAVLRHADQALATAKQHGRDRAVSSGDSIAV